VLVWCTGDLLLQQGNTPLHLSAGWGNLRCCVLVLQAGASVEARNHASQTAEQLAAALAREDSRALLTRWKPLGLTVQGWLPDEALLCLDTFS
jgi:hypothetical protein